MLPPTLVAAVAAANNNTDGSLGEATPALFGFNHTVGTTSFNGSLVWAGDGLMSDGNHSTTGCGLNSNAIFDYTTNPVWRQLVDELHVDSVILIQRGGCQFDQAILHAQFSKALTATVLIVDPASSTALHMKDAGLGAVITIASFYVYGLSASTLLTYWRDTHPLAGETELTIAYEAGCAEGVGVFCPSSSTGAAILPTADSAGGLSTRTVGGISVAYVVIVAAVVVAAYYLLRRRLDSERQLRSGSGQEFVNLA